MKLLAIEFTGEYIHILHIHTKNNLNYVDKVMHIPMPQNCYMNGMLINNDHSISDLIAEKLKEEKIRDKKTVVSASGNDCLIEEFSVLNDKKTKVVDGMVEQELIKRRKLNANYIFDYVVIGPDPLQEGYIKVKVVLCPKAFISNYHDVIKKAGLEPYKLDLISHSMEFLAEKSKLSLADEISILACINQDDLHFIYCGRNEEPYYRHATIKKDDMLEESMFVLSASSKFNLGLDSEENLAETVIENLSKLTRFHSQRHPDLSISAIYVYGDYSDVPTLCDRITNAIGIKARTFNPISSINNLSMRSAEPLSGSINVMGTVLTLFDPRTKNFGFFEELEALKKEKNSDLFWLPTMISIILAAVLVCIFQVYNIKNKTLENAINDEEQFVKNEYNIQTYETINGYLEEITSRYEYNDRAVGYVGYFENVNRLGKEEYEIIDSMVSDDVYVDSLTYNSGTVSIHCIGTSQFTPSAFAERLSMLENFDDVAYTGYITSMQYDTGNNLYSFSINMNLSQQQLDDWLEDYKKEVEGGN